MCSNLFRQMLQIRIEIFACVFYFRCIQQIIFIVFLFHKLLRPTNYIKERTCLIKDRAKVVIYCSCVTINRIFRCIFAILINNSKKKKIMINRYRVTAVNETGYSFFGAIFQRH